MVSLVLAIARNGVIGNKGALPWRFPEDMKHFKSVTMGHAIIMGRKTFESIGKPLPGRRNIVVSSTMRTLSWNLMKFDEAVHVAPSLGTAISLSVADHGDREPCVIGGASVYREALPLAHRIYLTEVDLEPDGDVRFELDRSGFVEIERRAGATSELTFVTLERRP